MRARGFLIGGTLLAATGCATTAPAPPPVWLTLSGGSIQAQGPEGVARLHEARYRCAQESRVSSNAWGWGIAGMRHVAEQEKKAQRQAEALFGMCMNAAGYRHATAAEIARGPVFNGSGEVFYPPLKGQ
jgi:hypothetical protein